MAIKECMICGVEFDGRCYNAATCSVECRRERKRLVSKTIEYRAKEKASKDARREEINARRVELYRENPEPHRKRSRDYAKAHPEKHRERQAKYFKEDPEKFRTRKRLWLHAKEERLEAARKRARDWARENPERNRESALKWHNSQSAAASMLEACATMIQINERGMNNETE